MNPMTKEETDSYFAAKRRSAETEAKNDLKKTVPHLLTDIHDESLADPKIERDPGLTVARTMTRFASLQIALSKEADKTAEKNLRVANMAKWIAVAALVASILQVLLPLFFNSAKT